MKVIITGVGGFIGSNLAKVHLAKGDQVTGVDNFSTGKTANIENLPGLELITGGLVEMAGTLPSDADIVYHFASPASPEKYMALAMNTMEVNTGGTLSLLQYCLETGARLVFASTSEVYGDPLVSPQKETYWGNVNPIGPRSVYDEAKRFGETLVAHFQREHNVNAGIIRVFNTYGPNMDPYDGRVVSTFIRQALLGENLTIFGDGTQTRSFCFIDDLVNGIIAMGRSEARGPINLGNPSERTLVDLAKIVLEVTGSDSSFVFQDLPEDDPKRRCPDITSARTALGWEPVVEISEGIRRTMEWMRSNLNLS
jgi:nucleoside-diphosphate-sugar epimerase